MQTRHRIIEAYFLAAKVKNNFSIMLEEVIGSKYASPVQIHDFMGRHYKHFFVVRGTHAETLSWTEMDEWASLVSPKLISPNLDDELDREVIETARRRLKVCHSQYILTRLKPRCVVDPASGRTR